ncbi:hypothetical protein E3N88_34855 [Mikania micrantha]|uniref:Uncharacterized protein n=1 Tax=Mikania micrantha TaxID=192012 RepID=A0A5N6LZC5_9ASTR|nr:hypothetical protein E3N88_34855 [Mikania micrantha]
MVNVDENRARNGVKDCPESLNEDKIKNWTKMCWGVTSSTGDERWECNRVVSEPQRFPYVVLDDTPSSSSGYDSDPTKATSSASHTTPLVPHTPSPIPATPPPPSVPSISPRHSQALLEDASAQRRQSPSPQRVLAWDGLKHMRGQARKTTWLPPRRKMAPRDEPNTIHEVGESSYQAEIRAQLQQVTQDLQGTHQSLQQCQATAEDTRMTILEILTSHLTLMDQIVLAAFWRQVALMRGRWMRMSKGCEGWSCESDRGC